MENEQKIQAWMQRTEQLLGTDNCKRLLNSHVLVVGMGGVGSMAAEQLVRSGIGKLTIVDNDCVQESNINRQVPALHSTIGRSKVEVMKERLLDINPELSIDTRKLYLDESSLENLFNQQYDFIVDAIDTLTPKILFIEKAVSSGIPFTSSMGSGGKTDPGKISITDFKKTYNCRLAYLLRKKLRKRGIEGGFQVVFSSEQVNKELLEISENEPNKKSNAGTVSYIPAIFGAMLASIVIRELCSS